MAYTNFAFVKSSDAGAPVLTQTNGSITNLIDTLLTTYSNWTRVFDDGLSPIKHACWAPADSSVILSVNHDSAVSGSAAYAVVRAAESQSSGTLTDAFPTVTQVDDAHSNILGPYSAYSGHTDYPWEAVVCEDGIILFVNFYPEADTWEMFVLFRCPSRYGASDVTYNWLVGVRNSNSAGGNLLAMNGWYVPYHPSPSVCQLFAMRSADGIIKSELAIPDYYAYSPSGAFSITGIKPPRSNLSLAVERKRMFVHTVGTSSMSTNQGAVPSMDRFEMPHLFWLPTSTSTGFSHTDDYNDASGKTFKLYRQAAFSSGALFLQTSNDWSV